MKRKLLLLWAVIASAMPTLAYDFTVDGLCYNINSDGTTVTVTYEINHTNSSAWDNSKWYSSLSGDITIPTTVTNSGKIYSVTTIDSYTFCGCYNVTSVSIPNSVTSIGKCAFYKCSGLTSVTIGNSVTSIGNSAFYNCSNLTSVTIPNSVTSIGASAFYNCYNLTSVVIPNSVIAIGNYAFGNCSKLKIILSEITTPENIGYGSGIFSSSSNCTLYVPSESVDSYRATSPWKEVFMNTIKGYDFIDNCLYYKNNVDGKSTSVVFSTVGGSVVIPKTVTSSSKSYSVTEIGNYAFACRNNLTSVTIGEAVTTIGSNAFQNCSGLTTLTIPAAVTSIGSNAFQDCTGVVTLNYRAKALATPGNLNGLTAVTTVNFDGSAAVVPANLLSNYSKLSSVSIGKSVASIESGAFNNCKSIEQMVYNAAKCTTGELNVQSLKTLTIGANVTEIPSEKAFYKCNGLDLILFKGTTPPTLKNHQTFPNGSFMSIENKNAVASYKSKYKSLYTAAGFSGAPILPYPMNKLMVSNLNGYSASAKGYAVSNNINYSEAGFIIDGKAKAKSQTVNKDNTANTVSFNVENIPNLLPGVAYNVEPYVVVDGTEYVDIYGGTLNVPAMQSNYRSVVGPSTIILDDATAIPDKIKFKSATFTLDNKTYESYGNSIIVTGLHPYTTYSGNYSVEVSEGGINSTNVNFWTPSLTLNTQPATMLTNTAAMLQSYTNLSEEETSCGFLWKRYDAPDEMLGNPVYCPVFDGMMMGTLKNMPQGVYYKYRSFYRANDGSMYYGDWVAFYTGDATIEFEPVAHTYNNARVSNANAIIQGIALRGSKDITEQGFEYWIDNSALVGIAPLDSLDANKLKAAAGSVNKVNATGERMSATLDGLRAGNTYLFRAFVKTASGTTYGELRSFTVPKQEINGDINGDGNVNTGDVSELYSAILQGNSGALYDLNGDGSVNTGDVSALYSLILGQ